MPRLWLSMGKISDLKGILILRVSRRKTGDFFPCGAFLSRVVDECLSKCPNSEKTPLP